MDKHDFFQSLESMKEHDTFGKVNIVQDDRTIPWQEDIISQRPDIGKHTKARFGMASRTTSLCLSSLDESKVGYYHVLSAEMVK